MLALSDASLMKCLERRREYVSSVGINITVEELQRITDILVECCLRPQDDDLKKRIKALDKWVEDKKQKND